MISRQLREGVRRKRVGLVSSGAPARSHTEICDAEGNVVGQVTSGMTKEKDYVHGYDGVF